jgi:asparaginyl-tRNA synthetase
MPSEFVQVAELKDRIGSSAAIRGWLKQRRSSGKIKFLVVRDGSGEVQCVAAVKDVDAELFDRLGRIPLESSIEIRGTVREDKRSPLGCEIGVESVNVIHEAGEYPIQPKEHGVEFLFDQRHLYLRHKTPRAVLRVRHEVVQACRDYFYDNGFVNIDSPILTPAACEGTTTLFETPYFDTTAFLAQSGQLYVEPACMSFGKVYCFGPTFRAEKSKTRRHLTEFWMIEPEVAFMELDGLLKLAEDFVSSVVGRVVDRCGEQLEELERDVSKLESIVPPFPRMTYDEAAEILVSDEAQAAMKEADAPLFERGADFGGFDETYLTSRFDRPVMVTHWPAEIKAFYMQPDAEDPTKALCVDMLAPEGYGEIIGGSQRIHDHDLLLKRIEEHGLPIDAFQWYLDIRKYGSVPHSGFGMGIERFVTWICGIPHLREAIPYPRQIHRLYP